MKYLFPGLFLCAATSAFSQKTLLYADKVYEPQVKTVQIHPSGGEASDDMLPSAGPLGQTGLMLEFDDLQTNRDSYYARVIHCNYDWTKSQLMDLDYLRDYNEFPLNDYTLSSNNFVPYIHYQFAIPEVKIAGNYLLVIYRDGDKSDLIISRRFLVYMNSTSLLRDNQMAGSGTLKQSNQQLNFTIDYSRLEIMNPLETVHLVIRQNQRWDNAKSDVKPSFIRDNDRQLEYHFFDQDNFFNGGNEFRWVDFRSLNSPGQNTGSINKTVKPYHLFVQRDVPRTDQAYAQYNDLNGNYIVDNQDYGEPKITGNYIDVTFTLNSSKALSDPVYLIGAFNGWDRNDENKMKYDAAKGTYETTIQLKQGLYNYQYWVDSRSQDGNYLEGSHFETENVYEILVYNHSFQPNADLLIGYFLIPVNPR